jgi:hypothetical protein
MATKNNWFTTNLKDRTKENLCAFNITLTPYEFTRGNFYEMCNNQATELYEHHDKLYLSYSGGLDSEFVLKVFNDLKLDITPVIVMTPYNDIETQYALKFCKERSIIPEIVSYTETEIVDRLKEKSIDRGYFSLLGGLPLIICDLVNQAGGKLLTGYGDPFTITPGLQPTHPISEKLEMSEWDYYLDTYDSNHPSGFFTHSLEVFYSLLNQIRYDIPTQVAKYSLYRLTPRMKMYWKDEFYAIFREMKRDFDYNYYIQKTELFNQLDSYTKEN